MHISRVSILLSVTVIVACVRVQATKLEKREKKLLNLDLRNEEDNSDENPVTWSYNEAYPDNDRDKEEQQIQSPDFRFRKNKVVANDESFSASLLLDIRDMLYRETEEKNALSMPRAEQQRLESMAMQAQDSVNSMADDIERYREFMDEKVNLVLETFSTLRLLVVNQGNQLNTAIEMFGQLEARTSDLEMQIEGLRKSNYSSSDQNDNIELEVDDIMHINKTSDDESLSLNDLNIKLNAITITVSGIQDELKTVQSNVTELVAVSQELTVHEKPSNPSPIITDSQHCQCPVGDLKESVAALERDHQTQKDYVEKLARNLTHLQAHPRQQPEITFSNRLGEVEGSLRDLNTVKKEVTSVKESLISLKEELHQMGRHESMAAVFRNATIGTESRVLCVYPYTRCGESCFYLHNNKRLNWMAARDYCRSIQGDLASPDSYEDFKNFIGQQRLSRAYTYWLGASDINQEGSWIWVDGRPIDQNSTVWATGKPSDSRSANCMAFKPNNKFEIIATDEECRISKYFICEQEHHTTGVIG